MSCILNIKIGDSMISVEHDSPLISNSDLLKILEKSDKWPDIVDLLQKQIKNSVGFYEDVTLNDLGNGLIPNTNIAYLQAQFPEAEFPSVDVPILLLDNLKLGGNTYYGRAKLANGQIIYVVKNTEKHVRELANFLKVQEIIQEKLINFSENSEEFKILNAFVKKKKFNNIEELLVDFSENKSKYNNVSITYEGKSILGITYLEIILRNMLELNPKKNYSTDFVTNISRLFKYKKDPKKKNKYIATLNINSLYSQISTYHPDILKQLNIQKVAEFKEFFAKPLSEISEDLSKIFGDITQFNTGYEVLCYNLLNKQDLSFTYFVHKASGIELTFKTSPRSISDKYGVTQDTIAIMEIVDHDYDKTGYKIYAQHETENNIEKTYYYPSRHYLKETTVTSRFETLEEAQQYILHSLSTKKLRESSSIGLQQGNTEATLYVPKKTIIEVLDLDIDLQVPFKYGAHLLQPENTIEDFKKFVQGLTILSQPSIDNIIGKIKNSDQVYNFLYKLNTLEDINDETVKDVVESVINATKKYYYVEDVKPTSEDNGIKKYKYTLIETNPNEIDQYKQKKTTPVIRLLTTMQEVFGEKHNVQVHLYDSEQILQEFPETPTNAKAFIRNGEIYVNTDIAKSTDLLHEYSHLLLGILKSNPETRKAYEDLLWMYAHTDQGRKKINALRDTYSDISEMDLMEEAFVKQFSNYLRGKMTEDSIFYENPKYTKLMEKGSKTIFDLEGEYDLRKFYNKSIQEIFGRFSYDISTKLKEDRGLDFSSTINIRKKTNWVNKQIQNGKIKEDCNG